MSNDYNNPVAAFIMILSNILFLSLVVGLLILMVWLGVLFSNVLDSTEAQNEILNSTYSEGM